MLGGVVEHVEPDEPAEQIINFMQRLYRIS